jgi:hypothetical protein
MAWQIYENESFAALAFPFPFFLDLQFQSTPTNKYFHEHSSGTRFDGLS